MSALRVGVMGAGNISQQYFATFGRIADEVRVVAIADQDAERAQAAAAANGARAMTPDALIDDPEVDLIVNLTIPTSHADVAIRTLQAGKHSYGEKPLAMDLAQAQTMLDAAATAGRWLGCAPDTVLGSGIQTARRAIEDGAIGTPVAASAAFATAGHEAWHPNPEFYYQPGGGPLLDMGPYYVTALVHLLGPVVAATGASSRPRTVRTVASGPNAGREFPVEIDTHVTGVLEHAGGALSTITMSFDSPATRAERIEVHGTAGSLVAPDPNGFDGETLVRAPWRDQEWTALPASGGYLDGGRGIGVLDFVRATSAGVPRVDASVAFHALDVMESLLRSATEGRRLDVTSTVTVPEVVELTRAAPAAG